MGAKYVFNPLTGNLDTTDVVAFNGEVNLGTAAAPSVFFTGDTNTGIYSPGADQVAISTNGQGRLFIESSGNVGIGTSSVSNKLVVNVGTAATDGIYLYGTGGSTPTIYFGHDGSHGTDATISSNPSTGHFQIVPRSGYDTVFPSGRVGIGTTSPAATLEVNGDTGLIVHPTSANTTGQIQISGTRTLGSAPVASVNLKAIPENPTGNSDASSFAIETRSGATGVTSEKLRITSDGKVGIGTSAPQTELEVEVANDGGDIAVQITNQVSGAGSSNTTASLNLAPSSFGSSSIAQLQAVREGTWGSSTTRRTALAFKTTQDTSVGPVDRLYINPAGNVGIGTTSPQELLDLYSAGNTTLRISGSSGGGSDVSQIDFFRIGSNVSASLKALRGGGNSEGQLAFYTATSGTPTEKARIDSSGRLLVGTSSARTNLRSGVYGSVGQIETAGTNAFAFIQNTTTNQPCRIVLAKQKSGSTGGNTSVAVNDNIGSIEFLGNDGTNFIQLAAINSLVDGTPGTDDMPGRLVFSTTADGASSPTEQLRITSDRYIRLASGTGGIQFNGDTAAANALDDYEEGTWTPVLNFGGATTGITYNARQGYYVKIGKIVFLTVYLNLSSKGTATGNATITGIPFTAEDFNISGTISWPGAKPSRRQNETSADFAMSVQENTTTVGITNGSGGTVTDSTFTNGTIIECALSYRAA